MFKTLFRREVREIFSGFIFLPALSMLTVLVLLSAYIQAQNFRNLVEDYSLRQKVHQSLNNEQAIVLSRPLPPLFPFFNGAYDSFPDEFRLQNDPVLASPLSGDITPLDWLFPKIDLGSIVGVLVTLIALLLAHNAVADEKERGTLQLILAGPVTRRMVLATKLASILLTIISALLYTASLYILVVVASSGGTVVLSADVFGGLALYLLAGILVLIVFAALGIVISVSLQRSSVALVVCLSIWCISVLVWPSFVSYLATPFLPVSSWEATQRESALKEGELIRAELTEHRKLIEALKAQNGGVESAWSQYLEIRRKWIERRNEEAGRLNEKRKREIRAQRRFANGVASLSPYAIFNDSLGIICDTGLESYENFLSAVEQYGQSEFQPASFLHLSQQKPWLRANGADAPFHPRSFQARSVTLSLRLKAIAWPINMLFIEGILLLVIGFFKFERYDLRL